MKKVSDKLNSLHSILIVAELFVIVWENLSYITFENTILFSAMTDGQRKGKAISRDRQSNSSSL